MSETHTRLQVMMPGPGPFPYQEHLWRLVGAHLGLAVRFGYPSEPAGEYRVFCGSGGPSLRMPFEGGGGDLLADGVRLHRVRQGRRRWKVLAGAKGLKVKCQGADVTVNTDLIGPLGWLLSLGEEGQIYRRDRYGLFQGQDSVRRRMGALSEPIFENTAAWIGAVVDAPLPPAYAREATWAVAVSCDVDVLGDGYIPAVLEFLDEHRVERPTFMICAHSEEEGTIRDPSYDITTDSASRLLEPLRQADVEVGLHGSYLAHDRPGFLMAQKCRLEQWWGRSVQGHRAHFYRFAYPRSWAWQHRCGFLYDASLGYPDLPGLRSACASPTMFYDHERGSVPFTVFPTAVLDQHFFWPTRWSRRKFRKYISALFKRIARINGALLLDWHTYTIDAQRYRGWWDRLDEILSWAREAGACSSGIGKVLEDYRRRWERCTVQCPALVLGDGTDTLDLSDRSANNQGPFPIVR